MEHNIKKELVQELRAIYDNKDFVCGAISNAGGEDAWKVMLDYIRTSKQLGDSLTSDDILLLSLDLREDNTALTQKKNVRVAML